MSTPAKGTLAGGAERPGIRAVLRRLSRLWSVPEIAGLTVLERPSLRRTLGRFDVRSGTIELSPAATREDTAEETLTHEAAHAAVVITARGAAPAPHGREWRVLMAEAGYPNARAARWTGCVVRETATTAKEPSRRPVLPDSVHWVHSCPVCHVSRTARRPVRAWRCAACVSAGLPGHLDITRRGGKP